MDSKVNLWNVKNLPIPPIITYKTLTKDIDITYLRQVLQEGTEFFDDDKHMYAEFAALCRIVYRMKQKFRSAKDFKAIEKLKKCLQNYFSVNIKSVLRKVVTLVPSKYEDETYLPSKSLLQYVLVRLQGQVKLMERIVETSKIAAYLLDRRIRTGDFWKIAVILFSIASRLYILAKYTANYICEFYNKLLPFSKQLKNAKVEWLPSSYPLPKDLKEWLDVRWLNIDEEVQIVEMSADISQITQFFDLVEDDDVEFCDEYVMIDDEDDDDVQLINKPNRFVRDENMKELRGFDVDEDIGEVIEVNDTFSVLAEDFYNHKPHTEDINESIIPNASIQGQAVENIEHYSSKSDSENDVTSKNESKTINGIVNTEKFEVESDVGEVISINDEMLVHEEEIYKPHLIKSINKKGRKTVRASSPVGFVKNKRRKLNTKTSNSFINIDDNDITTSGSSRIQIQSQNGRKEKRKNKKNNAGKHFSDDGMVNSVPVTTKNTSADQQSIISLSDSSVVVISDEECNSIRGKDGQGVKKKKKKLKNKLKSQKYSPNLSSKSSGVKFQPNNSAHNRNFYGPGSSVNTRKRKIVDYSKNKKGNKKAKYVEPIQHENKTLGSSNNKVKKSKKHKNAVIKSDRSIKLGKVKQKGKVKKQQTTNNRNILSASTKKLSRKGKNSKLFSTIHPGVKITQER